MKNGAYMSPRVKSLDGMLQNPNILPPNIFNDSNLGDCLVGVCYEISRGNTLSYFGRYKIIYLD